MATSPPAESWYRVDVAGSPAGWMVSRELRRGSEITSETRLHLSFKRGSLEQSLEMASRFVETDDGRPLSATSEQRLGATPVETRYDFGAEGVVVTRRQGEDVRIETVPPPEGEWLTPAAAQAEVEARLAAGAESFTVRTVDPALGMQAVDTHWQLEARELELATGDGAYRVSRWQQAQSYAPGLVTTVDLAADGRMVRSSTSMMGLQMVLTLSSREEVAEVSSGPELLVESFIFPDVEIARPRQATRAVYELRVADGELPELPSTGDQTVDAIEGGARVTVELGSSPRLELTAGEALPYLRATPYVDHRDERVRALHHRALDGFEGAEAARAEALRAFVHRHLVEKDLGSILATASEAAESRSGDCTEHAVLLAALLRADAIPSRVVTGLIYVDRFAGESKLFGYHMWTQAFLDGRWIDLDATAPERFDAAHITFATSALSDESAALRDMARLVPLMGRLEVEVVEVAYD